MKKIILLGIFMICAQGMLKRNMIVRKGGLVYLNDLTEQGKKEFFKTYKPKPHDGTKTFIPKVKCHIENGMVVSEPMTRAEYEQKWADANPKLGKAVSTQKRDVVNSNIIGNRWVTDRDNRIEAKSNKKIASANG